MKNRIQEYLPAAWRSRRDGRPANLEQDLQEWAKPAEELVRKHPGVALAAAFLVGAAIAWWIKRR